MKKKSTNKKQPNKRPQKKSGKTIRINADELPPPSEADLIRLRAGSNGPIDFSDIPQITANDWKSGRVQRIVRSQEEKAAKVKVSIRLDADLIEYFKAHGSGYQGRINQVLRYQVLQELAEESGNASAKLSHAARLIRQAQKQIDGREAG